MATIDDQYMARVLLELCSIPSPTGMAAAAIDFVAHQFDALGVPHRKTRKGALIATLEGGDGPVRTLLAHVDTLGAMVKEIKDNGRLKITQVGSYPWAAIEGARCHIHPNLGGQIPGTIVNVKASHHVHGTKQDRARRSEQTLEVRLDERAGNVADVRALGIRVGDFVSFDAEPSQSESGYIVSRHLDDKACVAILLGVARAVRDGNVPLAGTTHLFISNFEETGHGASAGIPEDTEEIVAVDMAAVGEGQTSDERAATICVKDSSGPYDHDLSNVLRRSGERAGIDYRIDIYPEYSSDASAALRSGVEARAALVGPGIDASHAHERAHIEGLHATAALLVEYLAQP